jgi:hypothetical protein
MNKLTNVLYVIMLNFVLLDFVRAMDKKSEIKSSVAYDNPSVINAASPNLPQIVINNQKAPQRRCWDKIYSTVQYDRYRPQGSCFCTCGIGCEECQSSNPAMIAVACIPTVINASACCAVSCAGTSLQTVRGGVKSALRNCCCVYFAEVE